MAVGVQRLRYGGVPQEFLHVLGVDVAVEQQRGAGMAEVVESGASGQTGALEQRLERDRPWWLAAMKRPYRSTGFRSYRQVP